MLLWLGSLFCSAGLCAQENPPGADEETAPVEDPGLPGELGEETFAALRAHSPFLRTLDLSNSLIITGLARIDDEPVATLFDLTTRRASVVSRDTVSPEGWQLVEIKGDWSDVETLTARIRMSGGSETFSIRYEKAPPPSVPRPPVVVGHNIGNGTPGGGTAPHGGPDPRVLTRDQLNDAREAARNIKRGFGADGYGDRQVIPPEVVSKISRLSEGQREAINVKMYEYRNRGLGMQERQQIYNRLLDQAVGR